MTASFLYRVLKSGINFLTKHSIVDKFQWVNTLEYWNTFGNTKFSIKDNIWQSENRGWGYSSGGITQTVDGLKKIQFKYKVSTEYHYDYFMVRINGSTYVRQSGTVDWTEFVYEPTIPIKDCLVEIFYSKDGSVARGEDRVWVKDLDILI